MLGNTCKVDHIIESQARGRFARICVEIDITKPLKGALSVNDRTIKVEYKSLGLICFICGRIGHSKELCKEGIVEQSKAAEMTDVGRESNFTGKDSFGPWMQVSYGRNGRNNDGTRNFGRRNGSVGNSGGVCSGSKSNNRSPANGAVEVDKVAAAKQDTYKSALDNNGKKCVQLNKPVNNMSKKSRFEILIEEMEENFGTGKEQSRILKQKRPVLKKVLSEISNKESFSNVQWSSWPKNYLEVNKSGFCKPFKENVSKIGLSSSWKLKSKEKQQEQTEEVPEDSEAQKMMDSVQFENFTGDVSMDANVDIMLGECVEEVDIPSANNFEEVASKL
ncbi:hypothetical protein Dsin_019386 [Dipteronia sinensis]|uniref:Zinc knuckle CX2CX4HX4C domain-containing protein n=1 Tax=Dipteronia sinensis TaxID=43782 RepID=A0AAE0A7F0_9ROSI|nr:hypothetical protein Dsin_019386 [Dipteronia sinensis]